MIKDTKKLLKGYKVSIDSIGKELTMVESLYPFMVAYANFCSVFNLPPSKTLLSDFYCFASMLRLNNRNLIRDWIGMMNEQENYSSRETNTNQINNSERKSRNISTEEIKMITKTSTIFRFLLSRVVKLLSDNPELDYKGFLNEFSDYLDE